MTALPELSYVSVHAPAQHAEVFILPGVMSIGSHEVWCRLAMVLRGQVLQPSLIQVAPVMVETWQ